MKMYGIVFYYFFTKLFYLFLKIELGFFRMCLY